MEIKCRVSITRLYDGSGSQHLALPHLRQYQIAPLITPAFCQFFCMVQRVGPWQQWLRRHSMLLINGVYAVSWIYTNNELRSRTQQPLLSDALRSRRLRFFGHICRADPSQDHSRALYASTTGLPKHWRRPGRPRQTWLRTLDSDLRPLNLGLATAQRRAQNRTAWQTLVEMVASLTSSRWWWYWWNADFSSFVYTTIITPCLKKNVNCLIFYNLKKL